MGDPRVTAAVQKDWKEREVVESVHHNMLKVAKFLNEFEVSMRFQLGKLSDRVNLLERNLELCEAALYGPPAHTASEVEAPQAAAPPVPPPASQQVMSMPSMGQAHPPPPPPPPPSHQSRPSLGGMDNPMSINIGMMAAAAAAAAAPAPSGQGSTGAGGSSIAMSSSTNPNTSVSGAPVRRRPPPPPSKPAPPPGM
eukprot:TRINITY_DN5421_c0_g1_i1.p1 TRINITY_DN5421_c0_g1~~TRINITY_DN5421_c0_g1_i1.p1  ORF type:complete len:196 (-),score=47.83 TRINITY_DN5421_c0_g1_i1:40-627(-)